MTVRKRPLRMIFREGKRYVKVGSQLLEIKADNTSNSQLANIIINTTVDPGLQRRPKSKRKAHRARKKAAERTIRLNMIPPPSTLLPYQPQGSALAQMQVNP